MRLLAFALLLLPVGLFAQVRIPGPGGAGGGIIYTQPALVHQTTAGSCVWASGSTFGCTITAPSVANVLIVACGTGTTSGTGAACSTAPTYTGAIWTQVAQSTTNRPVDLWCTPLSGSPGTSMTINLASSPSVNGWAGVYEISGTNGCQFDGAAVNNSGTSTTPTSGSITPTYLGYDLALFADSNSNAAFSSGPTNSFVAFNIPQASRGNTAYFQNGLGATSALSTGVTLAGSVAWDSVIALLEGSASSYSALPTLVNNVPISGGTVSAAKSTVNANLFVMSIQYRSGATCVPADLMGNTWTPGTDYTDSANIHVKDFYVLNPITSLFHTFSITGASCIMAGNLLAFHRQTPFTTTDGTNGSSGGGSNSISTGSSTPSVANDVCVSAIGLGGATISALANNASFSTPDAAQAYISGTGQPGSQAGYFLNPPAGVGINVGWTWTTNDTWYAVGLKCWK